MRTQLHRVALACVLALILVAAPAPALAVINTASGDIGGSPGSLGNGTFELNNTTLSLNKTAFLTNGTELISGATLPAGTKVDFLIWVDNTTAVPLIDVNISDLLDAGTFAYDVGTIEVGTAGTGATTAALRTAIKGSGFLNDAVESVGGTADVAGYTAGTTTISAGSTAGNTQLDVAATTAWGIMFTVTIQ